MLKLRVLCTALVTCVRASEIGTAVALLFLLFCTVGMNAQRGSTTMPPDSERQLAREIFKEMVEIKSGYTTGATTPVAEAAARRLKAAGFPDARHLHRRCDSHEGEPCCSLSWHRTAQPLLLLAHTDVVEANREDWSMDPFTLIETRWLLLRPRHRGRQGAGRDLDRQPHSLQA